MPVVIDIEPGHCRSPAAQPTGQQWLTGEVVECLFLVPMPKPFGQVFKADRVGIHFAAGRRSGS